jgi:hypothetical protein
MLTRLSAQVLRLRRRQADRVWREATRRDAAEHEAAVRRLLYQARGVR